MDKKLVTIASLATLVLAFITVYLFVKGAVKGK
ncbi:hypothetical protein phiG2_23 [Lysinibacillus phage phiG2]|nr:hypothetical protein phiG2_23 [Lysinibacillus phage phiG2]